MPTSILFVVRKRLNLILTIISILALAIAGIF